MKNNKLLAGLLSILAAAWLILGAAGCNPAPLPVPPPPQISAPSPAPVTSPAQPAATTTQTATLTPAPPPSSTAPVTGIDVTSNGAAVTFPDKITFALKGTSPSTIRTVSLEYGTDERSLTKETTRTGVDFKESKDVSVSWDWQMKKTGSIPPGATVWWQWVLTDADGKNITVPRKTLFYTDTRFAWQIKSVANMDFYWQGKNETLLNTLISEVQARLARIQLNVTIPAERKPKIFVYADSGEIKSALLFQQDWTGAVAFPGYNIILTAVNAGNLDWAKGALPHEITHLMVGEATWGPFGTIPTWLNEGLAKYSEGPLADYLQAALDKAIQDGTLIAIKSLAGSFPTSASGAYLAYGESSSIVNYLINTYGWEKMRNLLAVFKDGSTNDKALQAVYGFDVNGLDAAWRASIKAK